MEQKQTARIDITDIDQLENATVGQEVMVTITGTVLAARGPEKMGKTSMPGNLEVEVSDLQIDGESEYTKAYDQMNSDEAEA